MGCRPNCKNANNPPIQGRSSTTQGRSLSAHTEIQVRDRQRLFLRRSQSLLSVLSLTHQGAQMRNILIVLLLIGMVGCASPEGRLRRAQRAEEKALIAAGIWVAPSAYQGGSLSAQVAGYGAISQQTGLPKTYWTNSYIKRDGTVVRGYWHSHSGASSGGHSHGGHR